MRSASLLVRKPRDAKDFSVRTLAKLIGGALTILAIACVPALAEHTRWWQQSSFEEFDKGTPKGVALRSDGKLFLAPRFAEFSDANLAFLLALRADSKGNLYAAGGSNAKVLRIDSSGKKTTVFESSELAAQTLAQDAGGNLYVGTSPDGKVYKVTPAGQSSVFFDPKAKYIWDLAVDRDGTVYVATGDTGKIFEVAPDGKGQLFYSSTETHIRSLALDGSGNVLAGTEPSGLVLRIPKNANNGKAVSAGQSGAAANPRRAFVLYETAKKEITSLLLDSGGTLYVAAVGEKTAPAPRQQQTQISESGTSGTFSVTIGAAGTSTVQTSPQTITNPFTPLTTVNSSSVYRIGADGSPEELWSSRDSVVYTLGRLPGGKLLLGTGNQGAIFELDENHIFSRLVKTSSGQITSMASGPGGKLYLSSANPGKIFTLGPDNEPEGTYESQPFDAHIFSRWGRVEWRTQAPMASRASGNARIGFYARAGNTSDPAASWSPWAGPYSDPAGDKIDVPAARFVQWKAVLHGAAGEPAPMITGVNVAYLPKNVAPDVTAIAIQAPGVRVQGISIQSSGAGPQTSVTLRMPQPAVPMSAFSSAFSASSITTLGSSSSATRFDAVPQGFLQKGYQAALWTAEDSNDDTLQFAIYFRNENESTWKLLKDKVDTRFYSWDTTTMPDGAYYLKIVASDAPSNPTGEGLTSERESDRFEVDNTPPTIAQLTAEPGAGGAAKVRFQANDPASFIARAQYTLDEGEWTIVFPSGGLSDAPHEDYDFQLEKLTPGEHSVTVRVYDEFENVSTAKTTVRIAAAK